MIAILFSFLTLMVVIVACIILESDRRAAADFWATHYYCPRCNAVKDKKSHRFAKLPDCCK